MTQEFITALAVFLSHDSGVKSVHLQMGKAYAIEWSRLRNASPIRGYMSVRETEAELARWFGRTDPDGGEHE